MSLHVGAHAPLLTSCSLLQLDEPDYDARMGAYQRLLPAAWAGMARWQALPLLHHSLADLRNADDLALRHAAAQVRPDHDPATLSLGKFHCCGQGHLLMDISK